MRNLRNVIVGLVVLGACGITAFWLLVAVNHDLLADNSIVHAALIIGCTSLVAAFVLWLIERRLKGECH